MPSTIVKCKLFRIKHITLLEGETFLRNKHKIAFSEKKCLFFGRKENPINLQFKLAVLQQFNRLKTTMDLLFYYFKQTIKAQRIPYKQGYVLEPKITKKYSKR